MTSIRDLVSESLAVGERFWLSLETDPQSGRLVADHPNAASPMDLVVCEGLEKLDGAPEAPVEVELVGRVVDDRLVGRVVATDREASGNGD